MLSTWVAGVADTTEGVAAMAGAVGRGSETVASGFSLSVYNWRFSLAGAMRGSGRMSGGRVETRTETKLEILDELV